MQSARRQFKYYVTHLELVNAYESVSALQMLNAVKVEYRWSKSTRQHYSMLARRLSKAVVDSRGRVDRVTIPLTDLQYDSLMLALKTAGVAMPWGISQVDIDLEKVTL